MDKKVGVDTYRHGLERDLFVVVNGLLLVGRIGVAKACDVDQVTEVQRHGDGQQPRGGLLEGEGGGEDIETAMAFSELHRDSQGDRQGGCHPSGVQSDRPSPPLTCLTFRGCFMGRLSSLAAVTSM